MSLPKFIIPLTIQFSVRYVIRTGLLNSLRKISEPIILLGWDDFDLHNELTSDGYQVYVMPRAQISNDLARLRKKIQIGHFERIKSPTTKIDRRRYGLSLDWATRARGQVKNAAYSLVAANPRSFENWVSAEDEQLAKNSNFSEYISLIEAIQPDALLSITPYLLEEEFLIRAAAKAKVNLAAAILSFDNLTTRTRIPVLFKKYFLWNEYNQRELLRIYPQIDSQNIEIIGSPQFDFYYNPANLWDEIRWRESLGLPQDRPVILFGAGPESIAEPEPHIAAQLDKAISAKQFSNNPIILLRQHPVDTPARWEALRRSAKNIVFDIPWQVGQEVVGKTNITRYDIEKLASTLKHSCVHINTSSTMTLDGAIFDRPQIGPAYDDRHEKKYDKAMRELYLREHYLPITNSGGLQIAYSFEQLVSQIKEGFEYPERYHDDRKKMIRALCTYDDGKSTERLTRSVEHFLYDESEKIPL